MSKKSRLPKRQTVRRATLVAVPASLAVMLLAAPAQAAPDSDWDRLAYCEATGNWQINTGNGYTGGLQFSSSTWTAYKRDGYPAAAWQATRYQQIVTAEYVLLAQGWRAWPACSAELGLSSEAQPGIRDPWADPEAQPAPLPESAPEPEPAPPAPEVTPPALCGQMPQELRVIFAFFCPPAE